jgi:outer membrane lipoprotein-sorting protein
MSFAQNADQVINECKEALGGKNWDNINGMKMSTVIEQGGMQMPMEIFTSRDGKMYSKITIQGMEIIQGAFDGEVVWSTNFMTQKPEKAESDDIENTKRTVKEFPNALANYKELGYSATHEGEETVDGVKCHKLKLDKKTQLVEGKEVPNIEYYYIDMDSKALIMTETEIPSGEMKGKMMQTKFSDYQEVDGVMMPYSNSYGLKGEESQTITFQKIEMNPTVDAEVFKYKGE